MRKIYCSLIGFLSILVILTGCGEIGADRGAREALERADVVLDAMPDSAMAIVAGIDTTRLNTEKLRADYSLLRTMALLKTDPSAATEEGLKAAYDYYGDSDESSRQTMLTHFAKGAMADSALVRLNEFALAIKLADGDNAYRYRGLAWLNSSNVYGREGVSADQRKCIEEGLRECREAGDSLLLLHGLTVSGISYNSNGEHDKAEDTCLEILKMQCLDKSGDERDEVLVCLATSYSYRDMHTKALGIFDEVYKRNPEALGWYEVCAYARALGAGGRVEEAFALLGDDGQGMDCGDLSDWYDTRSYLYGLSGDAVNSLKDAKDAKRYANMLSESQHPESLTAMQRDGEMDKSARLEETVSEGTATMIWICLMALTGVAAAAGLAVVAFRRYKAYKGRLKTREEEHRRELQSERDSRKEIEAEKDSRILECQTKIGVMREDRIEGFKKYHRVKSDFCNRYIDIYTGKGNKALQAEVEKMLSTYRDKRYLKTLEVEIDAIYDGVLSMLRNAGLNDSAIAVVIYDICGFKYRCVAKIMKISDKAASVRRTRIKQMILALPGYRGALCRACVDMAGADCD